MWKDNPATAMYQDPDQESVRQDLTLLFGPRSDYYLKEYEAIRQRKVAGEALRPSWNWSVFFGAFVWFFYRKLYVYGAALVIVPIVLTRLLGDSPLGFSAGVMLCVLANYVYVDWALWHVAKANTLNLQGEERVAYLRRVGGVSKWAGGISGVLFGLIALIVLVGVFFKHRRHI